MKYFNPFEVFGVLIKNTLRKVFYSKSQFVRTGLPPGFHDKDEVILHVCFSLLVDFVDVEVASILNINDCGEKFTGIKAINYLIEESSQSDSNESETWRAIKELYVWWTSIRPARTDPLTKVDPKLRAYSLEDWQQAVSILQSQYRAYDLEDDEMLHRLVKVRSFLWI
jgi:hypothetical protein